ncbi:MAG: hypothetical protein V7677_16815, partial [Motiliproteus sp.]
MNTPLYPQAELVACYEHMIDQLQLLADTLRHSTLPLWIPLNETEKHLHISPLEKVIQYYCDIWYQDNQDGRLTR